MAKLTEPMRRVLRRAAGRERGNICPIVDARVFANAETMLLRGLVSRGLATNENGIPRITDAGRSAVAS